MADIAIFRINYKSDFILTLQSDAGWMIPFCIKFWTGAPSQAYYAYYDGMNYTHCAPVEGEPTKLLVQFDDHHLPIGDLKFQIGYHFTVADFPTSIEDEVINQAAVIIDNDGERKQVMLDFNGETAPEIEFNLPAYANEAQRIANEQARIAAEETRQQNEQQRIEQEQQRVNAEAERVSEFARLKTESEAATAAATTAAGTASTAARNADEKAAAAQAAATLANAKAQLADDKAALAQSAATLANDKAQLAETKAALAQQKADYAQTQGDYAKEQGEYAKEQGDAAKTEAEAAHSLNEEVSRDESTRQQQETARQEAEAQRVTDFNTQMQQQQTAFQQAEAARETAYEQAEAGRNTSFQQVESVRTTAFSNQLQQQQTAYTEAEAARETAFDEAEQQRDAKVNEKVADITNLQAQVGYFVCDTAAATAAKTIAATGYVLGTGGSMKVKMTNANTADAVTLNINNTGAKALFYNGAQASSTNSWEASEVVEVYYDGTRFQCQASKGSGENLKFLPKETVIRDVDSTLTVIAKTAYLVSVKPCQKIKIVGATSFVWLKNRSISLTINPPVSDYFRGWCECDEDGVVLFSPPDCYYILLSNNVNVIGYEEYKDFESHGSDLVSLVSYIANRSLRWLYHVFIGHRFGNNYLGDLSGVGTNSETSHRVPACLANNIALMLCNSRLDLGLVGTSKYALVNQIKRYMQALVDTHDSWTGYWQSSLTAAKLGETAVIMRNAISQELYDSIKTIVQEEADYLLSLNDGDKFKGNILAFHLYWKNAQGRELTSGDTKAEEVGWYASCLGCAVLMCEDSPNYTVYKRKYIEWCLIANSTPNDIGSDKIINGCPLSVLQGSNVTNDGIVINHNIIHPNYMGYINCIFFSAHAYSIVHKPLPIAVKYNFEKIINAYINYEFTQEKYLGTYQPIPPYGTIIRPGENWIYYPQGNDWGTELCEAEASVLVYGYTLGISPRYDLSRPALLLFERVCALQDRTVSGGIIFDNSENSYGRDIVFANCASTMDAVIRSAWFLTNNLRWTNEDWYNN